MLNFTGSSRADDFSVGLCFFLLFLLLLLPYRTVLFMVTVPLR